MTTLTGTFRIVRLILKRDGLQLGFWIAALSVVPIGTASAFISLYPSESERQALAATVGASPAISAILGPLYDTSFGGLTAWRTGTIASMLLAIMSVLTVVRHTRVEEETGRRELLSSTVLGRHAQLTAALFVIVATGLVIAVLIVTGFVGQKLPLRGAIAFGVGTAAVVLTFAGVGALAAQLTESSSTARGIGLAIAGGAFLLRMGGDVGESSGLGWMSWASPIGWFTKLRPFGEERWWVAPLWLCLAALLLSVALVIAARRDVGAGAFSSRLGPARASRALLFPLGLGWRLQRGTLFGWMIGLGMLGMVYGGAGNSIGEMVSSNPQLASMFEQLGGEQTLIDTYFSVAIGFIALICSAYAIRSVLRLRAEEEAMRAEPVLATSTSRIHWALSHMVYGVVGPVLILAIAGALAGLVFGLITNDLGRQVPRVLTAALSQVPAVWVLTGVAALLFGLVPHLSSWTWGVLAGCLVAGQLGAILQFPQWILNLSPFTHVPVLAAEGVRALPLVVLTAVAAGL
ncbi:MAG TPA: ABC transporter permease, partial [Acidimicrobiia bacterium]|nr:ABC transporter permease [Acidimicrobiia bacterium]